MSDMIERIIEGKRRDIGGFDVTRVLPAPFQRMIGPFIFFDQMGPARFDPGFGLDVRPHPHIGLATVTYLFEGAIRHRDSLGVDAVIRPGDVNWMTAGHGVVHSERTPAPERAAGSALFGIQTWVALPEAMQDAEPAFHHHAAASLPEFEREGARFRLVLGTAWGHESPVEVHSPNAYLHGSLRAQTVISFDLAHAQRGIYLVMGELTVDGDVLQPGQMAVIAPGAEPLVHAQSDSIIMVCAGTGLGDRQLSWNFVASDAERLSEARRDWAEAAAAGFPPGGRFQLPAGETEHIPLPGP